jgi:general stress protein YciG
MGKPKAFQIFIDNKGMVEMLTDEQAGQLFKALFAHASGEEYDGTLDQTAAVAAYGMKLQIDRDREKYDEICEKRANIGRKGGEAKASNYQNDVAKASKSKQKLAKASNCQNDVAKASKSCQYEDEDKDEDKDDSAYALNAHARAREGNTPEQDFDDLAGQVISEYNRVCVDLPECTELTMARRRLLYAAKMQDKPLDYFTRLFKKAQASDSICGRGDLAWKGHFDWIIKNAVKIMEGSYDNVTPKKPQDKRGSMYSADGASFDLEKYEKAGLFND